MYEALLKKVDKCLYSIYNNIMYKMCFFWFSFLDELGHAFLHTWKILECTTKGDSMLPTTFYQNQINPLKRTGLKLCSSSSRSTAGNSLRTRASFMATLDHHIGISWSFVDGRNPAPVLVGSLSQFLQGFVHPRWLA